MTGSGITISGFMIVKDVVAQGYPFLEAIEAALPVCDEFLVSDGCSNDETWPALQALQKKHPDRLQLFQDPWPGRSARGAVLAAMTNILKRRCRCRYCLNLQANEVLHESCIEELKALPALYPSAELFSLPFSTIMGGSFVWMTDYRRRLFKNLPFIISKGDAYDAGYDAAALLRRPKKFYRCLRSGTRGHVCYLSKPVYRYRALFPDSYLAKTAALKHTTYLWGREDGFAREAARQAHAAGQGPEAFWEQMRSYFDRYLFEDLPPGIAVPETIPRGCGGHVDGCPAIMGHLLNKWRYNLQDSLHALQIAL